MGRAFKLTPDVLIPRPETELLFETAAALVAPEGGTVVDVGTGSGVLAVSLAAKFPNLQVAALDISPAALAVARENGAGLANITFVQSDLLSQYPHPRVQLIVANLPYIPSAQIPALSREVRCEPALALDGGADGLDIIRRLIAQARGRADWLALEIGDGQSPAVCGLLEAGGFAVERVVEDIRKTPRVVVGKMLQ
jgi:release factor glutamine methyltransferase